MSTSKRVQYELAKRANLNLRLKRLPGALPPIPIPSFIKARSLAKLCKVPLDVVLKTLCVRQQKSYFLESETHRFHYGEKHQVFFPYEIAADFVTSKLYREPVFEDLEPVPTILSDISIDDSSAKPKIPVVAVMGHVDHGKTTLLDSIRATRMVDTEVGGITQKVSAFDCEIASVPHPITFLDTPGHEAFFKMRNNSAIVADAVVLVVAADEGLREQSKEVIRTCKNLSLPVIVALNKIDLPGACPGLVKRQLKRCGTGVTSIVEVSALEGTNVHSKLLMEALPKLLRSMNARSFHAGPVELTVLEARTRPAMGTELLVIVHRGILTKGQSFFGGLIAGRVKRLTTPNNVALETIGPGFPACIVLGRLGKLSKAHKVKDNAPVGEVLFEMDKDLAQRVLEQRELQETWESIVESSEKLGSTSHLNQSEQHSVDDSKGVIIRADTEGAYTMFLDAVKDIPNVEIVGGGIGEVTPADVELASCGDQDDCRIFAFNVKVPPPASQLAMKGSVQVIAHHTIFYELLDEIRKWSSASTPLSADKLGDPIRDVASRTI